MKFVWFTKKRLKVRRRVRAKAGTKHYEAHKERARILVHERLTYWNQFYKYTYKRVAIRNQRSRWGSCSTKQNLNFNYRLIFLPIELVDYVIVHELCHLKHFNHGAEFWATVAEQIPDYKVHIDTLHEVSKNINHYLSQGLISHTEHKQEISDTVPA